MAPKLMHGEKSEEGDRRGCDAFALSTTVARRTKVPQMSKKGLNLTHFAKKGEGEREVVGGEKKCDAPKSNEG